MILKTLRAALAAALLALAPMPALAAQATHVLPDTGPMSLSTFVDGWLNPALSALITCSSGTTAPAATSQPQTYQCWVDTSTTPRKVKIYDGASWLVEGLIDTSGHTWVSAGSSLQLFGSSSGTATIVPPAAAGTPSLQTPTNSGTFAVTASSPVVLNSGTGNLTCPTCVTSSGGGAITGTGAVAVSSGGAVSITGAAGQVLAGATPAFTATPVLGVAGSSVGTLGFANATSGGVTVTPPTGALGTVTLTLPDATDTLVGKATTDTLTNKTFDTAGTGNVFKINGTQITANTGTGSNVLATSPALVTPNLGTPSAVTLTNGTGLPVSGISGMGTGVGTFLGTPSSANLAAALTDETGVGQVMFNGSPAIAGTPTFSGSSSGTTGLQASATASGTLTLPAATDTLVGKATTDTLTNKTFDTAGVGNSFKINGTAVSATTGGGPTAVLANSPVLTTPTIGVATATTVNKVAITPPATGSTLTISDGKTLAASNTLTLAGTDGTTMTFPSTSATVARTDAGNTFTGHQTIEGVTSTGATGTGKLVFDTSPALTTPNLGTPSAVNLSNASNLPSTAITGQVALANGGSGQSSAAAARASTGFDIDQATSHGDSAYTIVATDRTVITSAALTAARTWTLPAASALNAGQHVVVADFAGGVTGTNTLTVQRAGSDTINGVTSVVLATGYAYVDLVSDGSSKWVYNATSGGGGGSGTVTQVVCGTGLSGGTITTTGTCAVSYGSASGTAAQGNDGRITGALQASNNLSDVGAASTARANLGLGSIATFAETTAAQYQADTSGKALSTDKVWSAAMPTALTDAATIAVDLSTGINFSVTLGGNRTLGNPSNAKVGQTGVFRVSQDGTGSRTLAYASDYKFQFGTACTLTTTASKADYLFYFVYSSTEILLSCVLNVSALEAPANDDVLANMAMVG